MVVVVVAVVVVMVVKAVVTVGGVDDGSGVDYRRGTAVKVEVLVVLL